MRIYKEVMIKIWFLRKVQGLEFDKIDWESRSSSTDLEVQLMQLNH